ncbi:hypothetical protein HK097_003049 [Rhizophlyctis rosea]|uniref:TauD/TfdA-like domain-containing protein n=1 Tax=Rhizophlyctis rosea TaxID=64517 RepID=A0AAD5X936_9FUNG|nr:hypothetical protein HK097_003049 [Rhizophlyctis rosea]
MPPHVTAESIAEPVANLAENLKANLSVGSAPSLSSKPLKASGALDKFEHFDSTPVIGREYPTLQIKDILDNDELIRDLAITIAERGVVFFRKQDLTLKQQKLLGLKLGQLTGRPAESGLHIHPIANADRVDGVKVDELGNAVKDHEISVISSLAGKTYYKKSRFTRGDKFASTGWHSDITFEKVPADFSILQIKELPPTGGDTLWASGYEAYDRISPAYRDLLEKLTGTYAQPGFNEVAKANGLELYSAPRGHPDNVGEELSAVHPLIRTNPITGWKALFAVGHHFSHVNDVTEAEGSWLKSYFNNLVAHNHDLQVRFKWNKDDVAIWDNRVTYHIATPDYDADIHYRFGNRVVAIGEKPYVDSASITRREALEKAAQASA